MIKLKKLGRVELSSGATHLISGKKITHRESQMMVLQKDHKQQSILTIVGEKQP